MFKHFMGLGDPSFNLNKHKLQCMEINKNRTRAFSLAGPKCQTQSAFYERIIYVGTKIWLGSLSVCQQFFPSLSFLWFFSLNSEINNPQGKIRGRTWIVYCKFGTKMVDISKNEGCVPSIFPIIIFQHPWGRYFFSWRKDQTPVATLHLLLANGDF